MKFQSFALIVCLGMLLNACDSSSDVKVTSTVDQMMIQPMVDMMILPRMDMDNVVIPQDQDVVVDMLDVDMQENVDAMVTVDMEVAMEDAQIPVVDMQIEVDMMQQQMLPQGEPFGQSASTAQGEEDLYYFEITEGKAVALETSSDGMGACTGIDTVIRLYAYQNDMRVEPEIDSNDDFGNGLCSKLVKFLQPGVYQVAVTGYNLGALAEYYLSISYPQIAALGQACDVNIVCESGAFCDTVTSTCQTSTPEILSANAYYEGNMIYLSGRGRDGDLDSSLLEMAEILDDNDNVLYQVDSAFLGLYDTVEFDFSLTIDAADFDAMLAKKVRFSLSDFNGHISNPLEVDISPLPLLAVGANCRTDNSTGRCDNSLCLAVSEGATEGICSVNTAPVVTQDTAVAYAQDVVLIVKLTGTDAEDNINAIRVKYLDANNMPVAVEGLTETDLPIYRRRDNTYYAASVVFDLYPEIVAVEAKLLDAGALSSESVYLEFSVQPTIAIDGTCDAYLLDNNCGDYICDVFRFSPNDPPLSDTGTCRDIAPRITSGFTTRDGNNLFIKINGIDKDQNILQMGFHALDAQGQVIVFMGITDPLYFNPPVLNYNPNNMGEFTASIEINDLFVDIPGIASFKLYVLDRDGYQSNAFDSDIMMRTSLGAGQSCDSYRVENVCNVGLSCENNLCTVPTPPNLQSATFSYNAALATPYLVVKIIATPGSAEMSPRLLFTPRDSRGNIVPLVAGAEILLLRNAALNELLPNGDRVYHFLLNNNLSNTIAQIELWMRDVNDVDSNHLTIAKDDTALNLQENEICDTNNYYGSCVAGLACSNEDGNSSTALRCATANPMCPANWTTFDLVDQGNNTWTYAGDSTVSENHSRGTCQGSGRDDILSFNAQAGSYVVTIDAAFDTVLYARDYCNSELASDELACNDDYAGVSPRSRIEFTLAQPQQIYIFVDAFSNDAGGAYTVTVTKQ